jgi:PAS domain S-box-containing protein
MSKLFKKVFPTAPRKLIFIIGAAVFLSELISMAAIYALRPFPSNLIETLFDSSLLITLLSPILYFFAFRPMIQNRNDRRQTEESLRKSEEQYRSLVESTDDSVYLVDRNYRYLFMNKKHMTRMGFSGSEYIGRAYSEFHSPEETEVFVEEIDRVFETGVPAQHAHWSQRDGRYFLRTLSPVKGTDDETTAVNVITKNITRLKEMEAEREKLIDELQEALERIKTLK